MQKVAEEEEEEEEEEGEGGREKRSGVEGGREV